MRSWRGLRLGIRRRSLIDLQVPVALKGATAVPGVQSTDLTPASGCFVRRRSTGPLSDTGSHTTTHSQTSGFSRWLRATSRVTRRPWNLPAFLNQLCRQGASACYNTLIQSKPSCARQRKKQSRPQARAVRDRCVVIDARVGSRLQRVSPQSGATPEGRRRCTPRSRDQRPGVLRLIRNPMPLPPIERRAPEPHKRLLRDRRP